MRRVFYLVPLLLLLQACLGLFLYADDGPVHSKTVLSESVKVDRVYKSMQGPYVRHDISLSDNPDDGELLWLKKVRMEFIDDNGNAAPSTNFMCHGHLLERELSRPALFTLIQGQSTIEFPGNFAVPVRSDDHLQYYAQVLNLDETEKPFDLRVKTTVDYIRDAEVTTAMKPLLQLGLTLKIPIEMTTAEKIAQAQSPGCDMSAGLASKDGSIEVLSSGTPGLRADSKGNAYSIHWSVPPGKHTYTYDMERSELKSDSDVTVHFATIHLHPYGRSMELLDLTTNSSVLKIDVTNFPGNGGIDHVNSFYSEEGVPLYVDHRYRITTEYDNPTQASIDAMAIFYLYLYDQKFDQARKKS